MKVLLLGEYSGFHTTLRDGLRVLGHDAIVAGTGDGSKAIPVDRDIGTTWTGPLGTAARIAKAVQFTAITPKVDVLQLINPHIFPRGAGLNDALIRRLRGKVPRLFLSACGDDAFFVQEGIHALRYNPIDDATIYDLGLDRHPLTDPRELRWNEALADMAGQRMEIGAAVRTQMHRRADPVFDGLQTQLHGAVLVLFVVSQAST